jgi:hypothetical protein
MRRIEEANKFQLARSIKALIARALADEMIEGGDARLSHKADIPVALSRFLGVKRTTISERHVCF